MTLQTKQLSILLLCAACVACETTSEFKPTAEAPIEPPAEVEPGAASAPTMTEHTPPAIPDVAWTGGSSVAFEGMGDRGDPFCYWNDDTGYERNLRNDQIETFEEVHCMIAFERTPEHTGLSFTGKTRQLRVPTKAAVLSYVFGEWGVFTASESSFGAGDVTIQRWSQLGDGRTWTHDLKGARHVGVMLSEGVLVVSWSRADGRSRKMLDAATGEVLREEDLAEAVWRVVADPESAMERYEEAGRVVDRRDPAKIATLDVLAGLGVKLSPSKNRDQRIGYELLDDSTAVVVNNQQNELRWVEQDSKRVLGRWLIRYGTPFPK